MLQKIIIKNSIIKKLLILQKVEPTPTVLQSTHFLDYFVLRLRH